MTQRLNHIVERFNATEALPEECPVCGDANADENGDSVFPADPVFCSAYCRDAYVAEQRHRDNVAATEYRDIKVVIAAHNARCPKCVTSPVYCFHQQ